MLKANLPNRLKMRSGEVRILESIKLKIVNHILGHLKTITLKLLKLQAIYTIDVAAMTTKEIDIRKMPGRFKSLLIHDQAIIDKRWDICQGCEFLIDDKRCEKCGCFMKVKTRFSTAKCPIDKWGKEYKFFKGEKVNGTNAIPTI